MEIFLNFYWEKWLIGKEMNKIGKRAIEVEKILWKEHYSLGKNGHQISGISWYNYIYSLSSILLKEMSFEYKLTICPLRFMIFFFLSFGYLTILIAFRI